jgi:thioredoxin 1
MSRVQIPPGAFILSGILWIRPKLFYSHICNTLPREVPLKMTDELDELREKKLEGLNEKLSYPSEPIEVTGKNFAEILQRYPLMVIDCWAGWCIPCKFIEPIIEELAKEYGGKIVFGKFNIDGGRGVALDLGIQSIPTLLVFKDGKLVDRIVGALPKEQIEERLSKVLFS